MSERPFWTHDTSLFEGTFTAFDKGRSLTLVRGKIHMAPESYNKQDADLEIIPLSQPIGNCVYIVIKPYVLVNSAFITLQNEQGKVERQIGRAQAWYYPPDKLIAIWACGLHPEYRERPVDSNPILRGLWDGFERFLREQFLEAEKFVTRNAVEEYDTPAYQAFLAAMGYHPHESASGAWVKEIRR